MRQLLRLILLLLALAGVLWPTASVAAGEWHIETITVVPYSYQGPAVVLDATGRPHVSTGSYGFGIHYAYRDAAGWYGAVLEGGAGEGYTDTAIALDSSGLPHISYYDYTRNVVKYAYRHSGSWITTTVDACVGDTALALTAANHPRLAYFGTHDTLNYAYLEGSIWYTETVVTSTHFPGTVAMVLDGADYPHLLYLFDGLHYAYQDAGGWHTEVVDMYAGGGDLALSSGGQPRISFAGFCEGGGIGPWGLCYAYRDGSGWHITTVDTAGDAGWNSSLALTSGGQPCISYYEFAGQDLRYAAFNGSTWVTETVDVDKAGQFSALALDNAAQPHIVYEGNFTLRYATTAALPQEFRSFLPLVWREK